jgi:hypothetical protein
VIILVIQHIISTRNSKFSGYQSKKGNNGNVKLFINTIWNQTKDFDKFVNDLIYFDILERICLERGILKIRMKNRCMPFCKMQQYAIYMTQKSLEV